MASIAFPALAKKAKLSDGTTYGYVAVAATAAEKPTFLLLHGYPSSCYDWRKQIKSLGGTGFGVIAPDLLGYGDTDKPDDVAAYRSKAMCFHMAELLDREGVSRCVAVGHDWGAGLLSRLATYIPHRLYGAVLLSVGYIEPCMELDVDAFNKLTEQLFGYSTYGYWPWHNTEESVKDCDEHPASVFTLTYPATPEHMKVNFAPVGAALAYVRAGKLEQLPDWYNLNEYTTRNRIIAIGGYRGPLNWYKAAMRGINIEDEAAVAQANRSCKLPTLLVVGDQDPVTRAEIQIPHTEEWVPDLRVETLHCGHWIPLEKPDELQRLLETFAAELTGPASVGEVEGSP